MSKKILKPISFIILILFSWALIVTLNDFNYYDIPAIVSLLAWIVNIVLKLSKKFSVFFNITLKGFFTDTISRVSLNIKNAPNLNVFASKLKKELEKAHIDIISFPENYSNKIEVVTLNQKKMEVKFSIKKNPGEENSIYISFEGIQNRHSKVYEYCERVDEYIRIILGVVDMSESELLISLKVEYPNNNNPVISEWAKRANINLYAIGKNYEINKENITVNGDYNSLLLMAKKVLSGTIQD